MKAVKKLGLTVKECLEVPPLNRFEVLTGDTGLENVVEMVSVLEAPDGIYWIRGHEFVATCGYAFRENKERLLEVVDEMAQRGLAVLGIKINRFLFSLPEGLIEKCIELKLPLLSIPSDIAYYDIISSLEHELWNRRYVHRKNNLLNGYLSRISTHDSVDMLLEYMTQYIQQPVMLFGKDERLICCQGKGVQDLQMGRTLEAIEMQCSHWCFHKFLLPFTGELLIIASPNHELHADMTITIKDSLPIIAVQIIHEQHKQASTTSEYLRSIVTQHGVKEKLFLENTILRDLNYAQKYICYLVVLYDFALVPEEQVMTEQLAKAYPYNKLLEQELLQLPLLREKKHSCNT